jgi:rhodanese-related sulfurtransferase
MDFLISNWPLVLIFLIALNFIVKLNNNDDVENASINADGLVALNNEGLAVVVDIRNPIDFSQCYIIGSINCKDSADQVKSLMKKHKDKTIVLVCQSGKSAASLAQKLIQGKSSSKIKYLIGGVTNWKAEGLPVLKK